MAMDVFVELKALIGDFQAKMATARGEMDATHKAGASSFSQLSSIGKTALLGTAAVAIGVGVASVKMAADFQSSMTALVTGAGESEANIKKVSQGILDMAPKVGATTQQLASGMYMVESAGFHGAAGLTVLKAAAEGAKVGSADLGTVADAVTTILNDYHLSAGQAATVTSKLVETVASGKTHMQDLAGSLAAVAPAAAAAHVGLNQVLGAMATMTAKGTPAADAATYLRQTILQLSNPTAKAATEMQALGLNAIDVSSHLGTRGLTGTLQLLTNAIEAHMGPQGTVLIEQMKKAAGNTSTFQKILANLPPVQQTYVGALANMVGGTKSMQAALELTGDSAKTFQQNVKTISGTTADAKGNVQGWTTVQGDFNQKLSEAKAAVQVMFIELGTKLIPVVEDAAKATASAVLWFQKHRDIAIAVGAAIGSVLVVAILAYVASMIAAVAVTIAAAAPILAVIAALALLGVGIYELVTHWRAVWGEIQKVVGDVASWVMSKIGVLTSWWKQHFQSISDVTKVIWAAISDIVKLNMLIIEKTIQTVMAVISAVWRPAWAAIRDLLQAVWLVIRSTVDLAIHAVLDTIGIVLDLITGKWGQAWKDMKDLVGHVLNDTLNIIKGLASDFLDAGLNLAKAIVDGIVNGIKSAAGSIGGAVKSVLGSIPGVGSVAKFIGLASGGFVTKPTLAVVGEAGPEYVIPQAMLRGAALTGEGVASLPTATGAVRGSGAVGPVVYVTVQGNVLNQSGFADQFAQAIEAAMLRRGRNNTPIGAHI